MQLKSRRIKTIQIPFWHLKGVSIGKTPKCEARGPGHMVEGPLGVARLVSLGKSMRHWGNFKLCLTTRRKTLL